MRVYVCVKYIWALECKDENLLDFKHTAPTYLPLTIPIPVYPVDAEWGE